MVTSTEYLKTAFHGKKRGQKTVKRPVGRSKERRAEDYSLPDTSSVCTMANRENMQTNAGNDQESVKGIRR